jgi:hypothetical protein
VQPSVSLLVGSHASRRDAMRLIYMIFLMVLQLRKQGAALGRSVDLSKFSDYDKLKAELARQNV